MDYILITFLWIAALLLIRNSLIYRYRTRAIDEVHKKATAAINRGDLNWKKYYRLYEESGSYDAMIFDLTKWKYSQFYEDLHDN